MRLMPRAETRTLSFSTQLGGQPAGRCTTFGAVHIPFGSLSLRCKLPFFKVHRYVCAGIVGLLWDASARAHRRWYGMSPLPDVLSFSASLFPSICWRGGWPQVDGSRMLGLTELSSAGVTAGSLILGVVFWLAARRNRRRELDRYLLQAFLDHIPDNVFFKDRKSRFVRVSRGMAQRFDVPDASELIGKDRQRLFQRRARPAGLCRRAEDSLHGRAAGGPRREGDLAGWPRSLGRSRPRFRSGIAPGRIIGTMGIARDITDRKQAEVRICHMALHDELTGLPNRALPARSAWCRPSRWPRATAGAWGVLMLDLDHFKSI